MVIEQARRLTGPGPGFGAAARWLSDSRRLLFLARGRFRVVDSDSGAIREGGVAPTPDEAGISVSRDNRLIAYRVLVREADIWLADPETPVPEGER